MKRGLLILGLLVGFIGQGHAWFGSEKKEEAPMGGVPAAEPVSAPAAAQPEPLAPPEQPVAKKAPATPKKKTHTKKTKHHKSKKKHHTTPTQASQ